jgi:hypothetical protein
MTKVQIAKLIKHEEALADAVAEKYGWWVGRNGVMAVGLERNPQSEQTDDHPYCIGVHIGPILEGVTDGALDKLPDAGHVAVPDVGQVKLPIVTHQTVGFLGGT